MQRIFLIVIIFSLLLGCNILSAQNGSRQTIKLLIADTTDNFMAKWDHEAVMHCSAIAKQLGVRDLKEGADSLEIRMWHDFSLDYFEDLSILRWNDTTVTIYFYRIYNRHSGPDNWDVVDEYINPTIDSVALKMIRISQKELAGLRFDTLWNISSESEIDSLKDNSYEDCSTEIIEIADKNRYKFLNYHCAYLMAEIKKVRDLDVFMRYTFLIRALTDKYGLRLRLH